MNTAPHLASSPAELTLFVRLGANITMHRPVAQSEGSSQEWTELDEDTDIGLTEPTNLQLRLVAIDDLGRPLSDPAWMIKAYTRSTNGSWTRSYDRDPDAAEFVTDSMPIGTTAREYRFTVGIPGSGLQSVFDLSIAEDDPTDAKKPDVIYNPADDFKPPPDPTASSSSLSLTFVL